MENKWNRDQLFNLLVCFETIIDCFTASSFLFFFFLLSSFSTPARRASPELYICCSGHPWRLCYYLPVKTRKERNLDGNEAKERFSSRTLLSFWTKKCFFSLYVQQLVVYGERTLKRCVFYPTTELFKRISDLMQLFNTKKGNTQSCFLTFYTVQSFPF